MPWSQIWLPTATAGPPAVEVIRGIAAANDPTLGRLEIPAAWNVGHDTVEPDGLGIRMDELNRGYLDLYEGRASTVS